MSVHRYSIGDRVTEEELAIDYFKHFAVGDLVVSPIAEIYNCDQRVCPPCVYRLRALAAGEIVGLGTYDRAGDIRAGRQYALVRYDRGNWECMAAPDSDAYKARNGAELVNPVEVPLFVLVSVPPTLTHRSAMGGRVEVAPPTLHAAQKVLEQGWRREVE